MTIDNAFLPELLELTKGNIANIEVSLIPTYEQVERMKPFMPAPRRNDKRKAFPGGLSAPQFVRDYVREKPAFHIRRDLGPAAEAAGFNVVTVYGAVARLAKKGVLKKTGRPGYYRHTAVPGGEANNGPT
jgi:hypothetical protein